MKNKRMNMKKQMLASALGLTLSAVLLGAGMSEVNASTMMTAEWFDTPASQRIGAPPAYSVDATKFENGYYKKLTKDGKKLYLFKNNQSSTGFYSPVARGRWQQYQPKINSEEQLRVNQANYLDSMEYKEDLQSASKAGVKNIGNVKKNKFVIGFGQGVTKQNRRDPKYLKASDNLIQKGSYAGKVGEWRQLGYSENGDSVMNNLFPVDNLSSIYSLAKYRFVSKPWTSGNSVVPNATKFDAAPSGRPDYNTKLATITKMYDAYSDLRSNMSYYVGGSRTNKIAGLKDRLSLRNTPGTELETSLIGVQDKQYYNQFSIAPESKNMRNMALTKIVVKDAKDTIVGEFSRNLKDNTTKYTAKRDLIAGEKVTAYYTVRNTTNHTALAPSVEVLTGMAQGDQQALATDEYLGEANTNDISLTKASGKLGANASKTVSREFTVPFEAKIALKGEIGSTHSHYRDNIRTDDDFGEIIFDVNDEAGNFNLYTYQLVDANGKEVNNPQPGEKYKVRFYTQYKGDNATRDIKVKLTYNIYDRKLPYKSQDGTAGTLEQSIRPKNNAYYSFTTPDYVTYEMGIFGAKATITGGFADLDNNYNDNNKDDAYDYKYSEDFDMSVSNVKLVPYQTYDASAKEMTYLMKYDVNYTTPSYVGSDERDVTVKVNVGGKEVTNYQHVKKGMNKNMSTIVKVPVTAGNKEVTGAVQINAGEYYFEKNYSNNFGSAKATIQEAGTMTVPSGTVVKSANWNQYVNTHKWSGQSISYRDFNNTLRKFDKFGNNGDSGATYNLNESYEIENVWFRSKVTKDNKQGSNRDGWIDLLKTTGQIKAGYGYELYVTVRYKTDAFNKIPKEVLALNGMWTRPLLAGANIPSEVFVQTPDKKLHSVNGRSQTNASMHLVSRIGDEKDLRLSFEVKPQTVLGTKSTGKFYVADDVANGTYNLNVFTPKITGLSGKMTGENTEANHVLQDVKRNLKIEVIGSAYDDVNNHIRQ